MTTFEYVLALISIMTSLALTVLVSGIVTIIREDHVRRVRLLDWMWLFIALFLVVGNWGAFWGLRDLENWEPIFVLGNLALFIVQYAFCEFVVALARAEAAEADDGPVIRERRRAVITFLLLIVIALVMNVASRSFYAEWLRDTLMCVVLFVFTASLLVIRRMGFQLAITGLLLAQNVYFLYITTFILTN